VSLCALPRPCAVVSRMEESSRAIFCAVVAAGPWVTIGSAGSRYITTCVQRDCAGWGAVPRRDRSHRALPSGVPLAGRPSQTPQAPLSRENHLEACSRQTVAGAYIDENKGREDYRHGPNDNISFGAVRPTSRPTLYSRL